VAICGNKGVIGMKNIELNLTSIQRWYSLSYERENGDHVEATICTYTTDIGGMTDEDFEITNIWINEEEISEEQWTEELEQEITEAFNKALRE